MKQGKCSHTCLPMHPSGNDLRRCYKLKSSDFRDWRREQTSDRVIQLNYGDRGNLGAFNCWWLVSVVHFAVEIVSDKNESRISISSPLQAWFMDEVNDDQRLPHRRNPNEVVSLDHLAGLDSFPSSSPVLSVRSELFYLFSCVFSFYWSHAACGLIWVRKSKHLWFLTDLRDSYELYIFLVKIYHDLWLMKKLSRSYVLTINPISVNFLQIWEYCTGTWIQMTMKMMMNCRKLEKQGVTVTWYMCYLPCLLLCMFHFYLFSTTVLVCMLQLHLYMNQLICKTLIHWQ